MSNVPSPASDLVLAGVHPSHADGGPCESCAFRLGTEANQSTHTMELARLSVEGFRLFHCHEHPHLCRGYVAAINIRGVPETDEDRRWCEVAGDAADILQQCIESAKATDEVSR